MTRCWAPVAAMLLVLMLAIPAPAQQAPPAPGAPAAAPPTNILPEASDADMWRAIRQGERGYTSLPDDRAARLIQSEGDNWRTVRNGPYMRYGGWIILGMVGLVALFFALRGRIRLEHDPKGIPVRRFNAVERFAHWLTAICFIVLALTGLNLIFGRPLLLPWMSQGLYATLTEAGKYLHNYLAFGFMLGVVLMFFLWVLHNLPNRYDLIWLARAGGFFGGGHPPAKKFNAGQKILFWIVMLGGISLSLSGLQLLFPFELHMFGPTFATLNSWFGLSLPADISPTAEQQLATLWHGFVGIVMTAVIIAHIYIGTVGMEGAFGAMGAGRVDLEWAREHHNKWAEEIERERAATAPAE